MKKWLKGGTIGSVIALIALLSSTIATADTERKDLSGFVRFSENMGKSFPVAVYITPELGQLDGKPFAIKATSFTRLDEPKDIADFCKNFQASRREEMQFPSSVGKPYRLDFVFRGPDPIVSFRLFNNPDGWFIVSQWIDDEGELNKVFKAEKSLIDAIEKRMAVLTK